MTDSPSQRWSSAVFDIFACARGRLPAPFLERRLADLGVTGVKPLPRDDLQRFEQAVELVSNRVAGRQTPGGLKPEAALLGAFPDDHPTLAGLRPLAQAFVTAMRPTKADKRQAQAAPEAPARGDRPGSAYGGDRPRGDRGDRGHGGGDRGQGGDRGHGDRGQGPRSDGPRPAQVRPAPAPRPPRISWDQWIAQQFGSPTPPPAPTPAPDPTAPDPTAPAPTVTPDQAAVASSDGAGPAVASETAPAAPAPSAAPVWVPPTLANWHVDTEARRHLARIRERVGQVVAAKAEPATALRELAFALLRPPLPVRDDLRALIAEHLHQQGVTLPQSALYPPPPVAALRRDYENLLADRGPADPAVDAAWRRLIEAHPESRAKLEAERAHELDDLVRRFATALREHGESDQQTSEIRARLEARHANATERIAAELTRGQAMADAVATAGKLIADHGWEDPAVVAAIAAVDVIDPKARQRLETQRRQEFDELDRRLRSSSREHGPAGEATVAALERLRARFPADGAAATARLERIRRGDDIAQQERERRETGRSLSNVHLGAAEHRLPHLRPAPHWRLVVALTGGARGAQPAAAKEAGGDGRQAHPAKSGRGRDGREPRGGAQQQQQQQQQQPAEAKPKDGRRNGHAVGWLIAGTCERGPVDPGWRAADSGSLDELDACVQAVVDREGGVLGLTLADCPDHGAGAWGDATWALAALAAFVLPVEGTCTIAVELPVWAEITDPAFDAALAAIAAAASNPQRSLTIVRAAPAGDHAASLAEAVAWSWGGRKEVETARIRQSGLAGGCLLPPSPLLRDAIAQLGGGAVPAWPVWSALVAEAHGEPDGLAAALLVRVAARIAADAEAIQALHRHLTGLARGRIAEPARLVRELAWFADVAGTLRPRDRLRFDGAVVTAQAAAGRIEPGALERFSARLAELREEWPAEVLEAALHVTAPVREALDTEAAEAVLAPWARADAVACGGRALLVRLSEERARIAAGAGRWKEARKLLDRGSEAAATHVDPADREHALARLATLRAAVMADDPTVADDEALAALAAALGGADPAIAAAALAVDGSPRHAHLAVLRWAVRRQNEAIAEAYLGQRAAWCDAREAAGSVLALRAVLLARSDADAARALLNEAAERGGGESASAAQRLSLLACAVAASLHGAGLNDLHERLAALRRDRPASAPAVAALERALALAPNVAAGLAEALPLLGR